MKTATLRFFIVTIATALILGVTGCSGGGGGGGDSSSSSSATSSSGGANKGPFKQGSLVVAYKLNADGTRDINTTTHTTDGRGHFSFSSIPWSGATEFVISGEYLNENTGTYMTMPADPGLSAIVDLSSGSSSNVNINILTNIAAKKIKHDMNATGASVASAKAQAQSDIEDLFNLDLDAGVSLEDLDLTDGTNNVKANTQLLMISSALLNTANPQQVMDQIASDIADGGGVDGEAMAAMDELQENVANVDLQAVATNMEDAGIGVTDAPDSTSDLNGTISFDHNISFATTKDAYRNTLYTSEEATVDGIYGGSGAISIEDGEYSIDGGAFVSAAGTVANGQKVRVRTRSSSSYSTSVEAKLNIGGATIPYDVVTKSNPRVADTTPDSFSFGFKRGQAIGANVTSKTVKITGINTATVVNIDNGTFKVNGVAGTSGTTTVSNEDNVTVTLTAGATHGSRTVSTVTIGGVEGKFMVFTTPEDTTPDVFTFADANDVNRSVAVVSAPITISGINSAVEVSIDSGEYSTDGGTTWKTNSTENNGTNVVVRLTSSDTYDTTLEAQLSVGNMIGVFSVTTKSDPFVPDTTPNSFSFATKLDQNRSINVQSDAITVTGINTPTSISVTNGTYSVNGVGAFTDGNVSKDDIVVVTQTTSSEFDTEVVSTLTIGDVSADFKTVTLQEDTTPDDFSFDSNMSVPVNTQITSNTVTITGVNTDVTISVTEGEYEINGGGFTNVDAIVQNGDTVTLRQTSSTEQGTSKVTTLMVGSMTRSFTTKTQENAPDISGTPATTAPEDTEYEFTPTIEADSGEIETWSIANKPGWAEFNTMNGRLSGIPQNSDVNTTSDINITATNAQGSSSITATISVTNTNDAPVAQDINKTTAEDTNITINVVPYVDDVDVGDTYTVTATTPDNGSVVVNGKNINYTPAANFFGVDSFTYTATDPGGLSATATITVTVTAVNDVPVIGGDVTGSIDENIASVSGAMTISDPDEGQSSFQPLDQNGTYGRFDVQATGAWTYSLYRDMQELAEGENLHDVVTVTSQDGTATQDLNITINGVNNAPTVVPVADQTIKKNTDLNLTLSATDVDHGAVVTLDSATATGATVTHDASGHVTFNAPTAGGYTLNYTFSDEHNATATGTVSITVTNSDAPNAVNDTATTQEDESVSINVLANDSDDQTADANMTVTVEVAPNHGVATIEANNSIRYVPSANYNGNDSFTYKITDEDGGFATADVNITVTAVDDTPVAVDDTATTDEDHNVTINVLANDSDVEGDDFNITAVTQGANGSVVFNATTVTYSPNADFSGTDTFVYVISDGNSDANATVTVTVTPQNDAPVISHIDDVNVSEDSGVRVVPYTITDVDTNASSVHVSITSSDPATVAVMDANATSISLLPQPDKYGAVYITVTANDGEGNATEQFVFTVTPVPDAPVAVDDNFVAVMDETATDWNILANDYDVDDNHSNANLSIVSCDSNSSNDANITYNAAQVLTYTPENNFTGSDTFSCTITDGDFNVTETIHVSVSGNHAPTVPDKMFTMLLGETINNAVQASDVDVNDTLTYTLSSISANLQGNSFDTTNGEYSITAMAIGQGRIEVIVTDDGDPRISTTATYDITVIPSEVNVDSTEYSEGGKITSAEFDAISGLPIPANTKMYAIWGTDTDNNTTVVNNGYYMLGNGDERLFTMYDTEDGINQGSHDGTPNGDEINGDASGGVSAYQAALDDQNETNKMATVKLIQVYSGSDINSTNVPTVAHITMPDGALVYKTAVKMTHSEYEFDREARDKNNNTYDSLEAMINNDAHGIVAYNRANHNRKIVFANDQNYTADANSSGIVVEVDTTNAPDIFVSNPNAGTWSVTRDPSVDGGNSDIVNVHITASGYEDEYTSLVYDCFTDVANGSGDPTDTVWVGEYKPADRSEYEYRFNDIANATLLNAAVPVTPKEWMDMDDNLSQDINSTEYDALGNGIRTFANMGDVYQLWIDREQNGSLTYELDDLWFGADASDSNFVVKEYNNDVLSSTETLRFDMDANNNAVLSDGSGTELYKMKIIDVLDANRTKALFGLDMPEGAEVYKVAGLHLVDSVHLDDGDAEAMATDGTTSTYTSIGDMIDDVHLDNNKSFALRHDGNDSYALAFAGDSNASADSGNLWEVLVGDTNATACGTWTRDDGNIQIHPCNDAYDADDLVFGMVDGKSNVQRGKIDRVGTGDVEYYANPLAKDIIEANFENGEISFYYSYFYGQTRYFVNQNNKTGYRSFALNYTFEGEVNGGAVAGNYMIEPFNISLENTINGNHLVFVHIGKTPDGEGEMFNLTINGVINIVTSMYTSANTRDRYVAP